MAHSKECLNAVYYNPVAGPYAVLRGEEPLQSFPNETENAQKRRSKSWFSLLLLCFLVVCSLYFVSTIYFVSAIVDQLLLLPGLPGHRVGLYQSAWFQCGLKCGFDDTFLGIPSNESAAASFRVLTSSPHVAGTPASLETAQFVRSKFQEYGLKSHFSDYEATLSYPVRRSLAIVHPTSQSLPLDESPVEGDPFSESPDIIPPYLAYVPSGNVTGEVVYANYGRTEDYARLAQLGVNVSGTITIVRYGAIFRGDKVTNAAKAGAIATLIYSDPEDAAASLKEGVYPESKWLPPTGVQRGSALPRLHGDPTTPGWPSTGGAEHLPASHPDVALPHIPALPLSYAAAAPILSSLGGREAPQEWWGGLDLEKHRLGRGPVQVQLDLEMALRLSPVRNVHALIEGSDEPDRYVILGNHRDAWTFGAVDPNSGTAALLEVARGLGVLLEMGWRPRRTVVLCSWDAEEMGLVGSTEWVEDNEGVLADRAVAYINVDSATNGAGFLHGGATPQLDLLLWEAASKVKDPDTPALSLLETWLHAANSSASGFTLPSVRRLGGSGTDYAAFVSHMGVAAIDFAYAAVNGSYPMYHTAYDDPLWLERYGDPGFHRTVAVAQLYGLLGIWLADLKVLPFNYDTYTEELQRNVAELEVQLASLRQGHRGAGHLSVRPILTALESLEAAVEQVNIERQEVFLADALGSSRVEEAVEAARATRALNDRLMLAERAFIASEGLSSRPWFRHLVYGPARDNGYGSQAFPGIADAVAEATQAGGSWDQVQHEIHRLARAVTKAAKTLRGELT